MSPTFVPNVHPVRQSFCRSRISLRRTEATSAKSPTPPGNRACWFRKGLCKILTADTLKMMYWFKYIFFLLVTLAIGLVVANGTPTEVSWGGVPMGERQMCLTGLVLASVTRFADAGSTCIALSKPGLVEGAPGLGHAPSRGTLYLLALGQSIILAVATLVIGSSNPFVTVFVLLVISGVSGMAAVNNQILYWLAPTPPDAFRSWRDEARYSDERNRWAAEVAERLSIYYHNRQVFKYNFGSVAVLIVALLAAPTVVVFLAGAVVVNLQGGGDIANNWPILKTLSAPKEWVICPTMIWVAYLCLGGLRWVELLPKRLISALIKLISAMSRSF